MVDTERRTAETPVVSTVHAPFGSPEGPGLFHVKGLQLPAYIQNVAHAFTRSGHDESSAIHMAVGVVENWAAGHDGHGNKVHPDVQAAAARAVAEWEAARAAAHGSSGRSYPVGYETRAAISTADQNDLPDSAFAFIEPGGSKDSSGKTVPRSLRHFPIHDAAHVRNALARASQSPFGAKAMPKIKAAAKAMGIDSDSDDDGGRSVTRDQEWRYTPSIVEVRAGSDGRKRVGGYGAVFGKLSRNLGGFVEKVAPTAFNQSKQLGWPDVVCRLNHDRNQLLGTSEARTLTLKVDNIGLDYEVEPPPSRTDVVELVGRGDIRNSSFAFNCPPGGDEWRTTDQNYPLRILHEVRLIDVAPVTEDPAYTDATAGLRSLAMAFDAPLEEVRSMAASDELRRFFTRTDNRGPAAPAPIPTGPQAMMRLMEKKYGPGARL